MVVWPKAFKFLVGWKETWGINTVLYTMTLHSTGRARARNGWFGRLEVASTNLGVFRFRLPGCGWVFAQQPSLKLDDVARQHSLTPRQLL